MLRRIDPANPILVQYLTSVNPNVTVGVLLTKGVEVTSKAAKASKKTKKTEQPKSVHEHVEKDGSKLVQENEEKEVSKEVVPSKTSILKRTNKPTHIPHHSPERPIVQEVSKHVFSTKGIKKIHKPQLNRRGVPIRKVPAHVSPTSKKQQAREMVKKVKKKK
ncbi:unnamed protein product [Lactuca virosa]|uniref:Uncharacterized protein n=1 Tax=Lactuca virosa TaxID=75947 RepID=A0AAU9P1U5_9ASTR|nr:unnamed protein product [Lactuca virosa]